MTVEPLAPGPAALTDEDLRQLFDGRAAPRPIIASVSGGKDSAAMALWLLEQGLEIEAVFLDTGWEHPATYDYLRGPLSAAIGEITWLQPERSMSELVRHKSMFPSRTRRFCTAQLKLAPFEEHITSRYAPGAVVNAIGVRADESRARAQLPRWSCEDGDRVFVDTWRPLIAWREDDVYAIHARHGLKLNPLYGEGAARVGCWPCIYARRAEIRRLAEIDPGRIERIRRLEREVGSTFFYDRGGRGATNIDEVVAWSRADGARDERFAPGEGNRGCMRWGLCDFPGEPSAAPAGDRPALVDQPAAHDGDDDDEDALSCAARGYRQHLGGERDAARAAYRRALSLAQAGADSGALLQARLHVNLALLAAEGAEGQDGNGDGRSHALRAEALADAQRGEAAAAIYSGLAALELAGARDLARALRLSERALELGQARWRPGRRALRMRIARALGAAEIADLEGHRGLQENPWHPALRDELERRDMIASSARRPNAAAQLSPVGLEPIGY